MSWSVTFTNPKQNYTGSGGLSADVPVAYAASRQAFKTISQLVVYVRYNIASVYGLETNDTANPLQLFSTAVFKRDSTQWFTGVVTGKPRRKSFSEGEFLEVIIDGPEWVAAHVIARKDGADVWSVSTSAVEVTDLPLKATADYGSFQGDTLWPDPGDVTGAKCYIGDASSNSDTLDTSITDVATPPFDIVLSTSNAGFGPRGFVKIDSEWLYYDGYDDTGAGGKYVCNCTARAQLGTLAAAHTGGAATVYEKIAKQIAPSAFKMLQDSVPLRFGSQYTAQTRLGCFVLPGTASGTYTCTHKRYDDDATLDAGSTTVSLDDVVTYFLTADKGDGGAGFVSGDLNFPGTGLNITRYDHDEDKSQYALQAAQDLIASVGLEDEVELWFDHTTGKWRLGIPANAAAVLTLAEVSVIETESTVDEVYSAVRVKYTDDQAINRVDPAYSSHVGCAATGAKPDAWYRVTADGSSWGNDTRTENTDAGRGNFGVDMLITGDPAQKLHAEIQHDPTTDFEFCQFWFGAGTTPPAIKLDSISIRVNNYRAIEGWNRTTAAADFTYQVYLQGCTDYNSSTNSGTWQDLGCEIHGLPASEGVPDMVEFSQFLLTSVNAVRVMFRYMAGPKRDGDYYWAVVHDLVIQGDVASYVLVQTSDTEQGDPLYYYAPAYHEKVRGGLKASTSAGSAKVLDIDIGPSSEGAAISIARAKLLHSAPMFQQKTYLYKGVIAEGDKPELGETITVTPDSYTGVLRAMDIVITPVSTEYTLTLLDDDASVLQ